MQVGGVENTLNRAIDTVVCTHVQVRLSRVLGAKYHVARAVARAVPFVMQRVLDCTFAVY